MPDTIEVALRDLPEEFTKPIHDHIRHFSVTMLIADNPDSPDVTACSGTLCQYGIKSGIITARHVWEVAQKHKFLGVMTERGTLTLKPQNLYKTVIPHNAVLASTPARVPDIAFIYLDPHQRTKLESLGKVFYTIKKRINSPHLGFQQKDGYWTIFGNPQALLNIAEHKLHSLIYGTQVNFFCEQDGWDYLLVNLDINNNPCLPRSFGGVSGGGVWRTMWNFDTKKKRFQVSNFSDDCVLAGISFYQTDGEGSQIIAHGPNSVYRKLLSFV